MMNDRIRAWIGDAYPPPGKQELDPRSGKLAASLDRLGNKKSDVSSGEKVSPVKNAVQQNPLIVKRVFSHESL